MWRKCQRMYCSCGLTSNPDVPISDLYPLGVPIHMESSKHDVQRWKCWRPEAVLVFLLFLIISRKCLFQRTKPLIIWLCEGVVSLISSTLVLASLKKVSSMLVCSDQPFHSEMKAAFLYLRKKKAEKITAPPGFKGTAPLRWKGNWTLCFLKDFSVHAGYGSISQTHGYLLQGFSQLHAYTEAWSCCFWDGCWCFDFCSTLKTWKNQILSQSKGSGLLL